MKNLIRGNREPSRWRPKRSTREMMRGNDYPMISTINQGNNKLVEEYEKWIEFHDKWSMTDWND